MAHFRCFGPLPDAHKTLVGIAAFASHWPIDSSHSGSTAQEPWLDLQIAIGVGEAQNRLWIRKCHCQTPKHPTVKNLPSRRRTHRPPLGFCERRSKNRAPSRFDHRYPNPDSFDQESHQRTIDSQTGNVLERHSALINRASPVAVGIRENSTSQALLHRLDPAPHYLENYEVMYHPSQQAPPSRACHIDPKHHFPSSHPPPASNG